MKKRRFSGNQYPDPPLDPQTGIALIGPRDRHQQLLDGVIQVEDLTIEELQAGKVIVDGVACRRAMPLPLQNRIHRALTKYLLDEFNKYGIDAIETITDIMYRGEGASAFQGQKDGVKRLDAAKYVLERIVGPMPTKSEISSTVTVWEGMQEEGTLFVDIEVEDIVDEPEATPPARTRGPRTRRKRAVEDS